MKLDYPDLGAPPVGWTFGKTGSAIRLVPPGAYFDHARAAIVVSPLVPISAALPASDALIAQALAAEVAQRGLTIERAADPQPFTTDSGLSGVRIEADVRHAGAPAIERRVYVMCRDADWLYGISYISDERTWPIFLPTFDAAAASIQPFSAAQGH